MSCGNKCECLCQDEKVRELRDELSRTRSALQDWKDFAMKLCPPAVSAEMGRQIARADAAEALLKEERVKGAKLAAIRTWVQVERGRRNNYNRGLEGRGGQIVGDSHSPRLSPQQLHELERMLGEDE